MEMMTLKINGETREIARVSNIRELLDLLGVSGSHVAIELNGRIIRRRDWEESSVSNLDRIEIVQFVGGG